jgi:hypothetical protein
MNLFWRFYNFVVIFDFRILNDIMNTRVCIVRMMAIEDMMILRYL